MEIQIFSGTLTYPIYSPMNIVEVNECLKDFYTGAHTALKIKIESHKVEDTDFFRYPNIPHI